MNTVLILALLGLILIIPKKANAFPKREEAKNLSPEEALEELMSGNVRYINDECINLEDDRFMREHTAEHGQYPIATIVACSDSRSPVETIFDQGRGDVFVIRVAGNIVGTQVLGSVEYSILKLNVPLVVVLGHTRCGAIYSAIDAVYAKQEFSPNIEQLLSPLLPLAFKECREKPNPSEEELIELKDSLIEQNVWKEMSQLIRTSEMVKAGIKKKELILVGGMYDIQTGEVRWLGRHYNEENLVNL